ETAEKQRRENLRVTVPSRQSIEEEPTLLVQPSLLLDEREEQHSREDQERLRVACILRLFREERVADVANCVAEAFEESAGDPLAIECEVEDARHILARREEVQPVEGVGRGAREIDVEPAQRPSGEIINSNAFISTLNQC